MPVFIVATSPYICLSTEEAFESMPASYKKGRRREGLEVQRHNVKLHMRWQHMSSLS